MKKREYNLEIFDRITRRKQGWIASVLKLLYVSDWMVIFPVILPANQKRILQIISTQP